MEKKITCSICKNEENKFCIVKKIGVAINKRRRCNEFIFEPSKVKEKQLIKTVKLSYAERESLRKHYKEQLKKYKAQQKNQINKMPSTGNPKHPLTGDLSRFTSTAKDDK